jgi:hypothetical protein
VPPIVKDCFGTVISTLTKMRECVRCELLVECRSINWTASEEDRTPGVLRRPGPGDGSDGDSAIADGDAVDPGR